MATLSSQTVSGYWQDEKSALQCPLCRSNFGLFSRKIHCRECGFIYCTKCSSQSKFYPFDTSPLPQCILCHQKERGITERHLVEERSESAVAGASAVVPAVAASKAAPSMTAAELAAFITGIPERTIPEPEPAAPTPVEKETHDAAKVKPRASLGAAVSKATKRVSDLFTRSSKLGSKANEGDGDGSAPAALPLDFTGSATTSASTDASRPRTKSDAELEKDIENTTRTMGMPTQAVVASLDSFSQKAPASGRRSTDPSSTSTDTSRALRRYKIMGAFKLSLHVEEAEDGSSILKGHVLKTTCYCKPKPDTNNLLSLGVAIELQPYANVAIVRIVKSDADNTIWAFIEFDQLRHLRLRGRMESSGSFGGTFEGHIDTPTHFFKGRFELEEDASAEIIDEDLAALALGIASTRPTTATTPDADGAGSTPAARPVSLRSGLRDLAGVDGGAETWMEAFGTQLGEEFPATSITAAFHDEAS